ncbi:MAG: hypothetical protein K6T75_08840 [Acetobacteraceae bacterium]|nr:hypothetical protein [Acetobacteraceae bacterium]
MHPVLEWLLDPVNPSVRYFTLVELLGVPPDSPEAQDARAAIMTRGPIPRILSRQGADGHFHHPRFAAEHGAEVEAYGYRPKYRATTWQLLIFAGLGAFGSHPGVRAACEYVLSRCWMESGLFTMEGSDRLFPCFQGNMVWALARLGFARDPRVLSALNLLIRYARFDDGGFRTPREWPYRGRLDRCSSSHSCYAGCARALNAVAFYGPAHSPEAAAFIERGVEFFLRHRVMYSSRNPAALIRPEIARLGFPTFVFPDFLEILGLLAGLGCRDSRLEPAVDLLLSRRQASGLWPLDWARSGMYTVLERPGPASRWTTYRALRALSALGRLEEALGPPGAGSRGCVLPGRARGGGGGARQGGGSSRARGRYSDQARGGSGDPGAPPAMDLEVEFAGVLADWLGAAGRKVLRLRLPQGSRAADAAVEVVRRFRRRLPPGLVRGGPGAAAAALSVVSRRTGVFRPDDPLAPGDRLVIMVPLGGGAAPRPHGDGTRLGAAGSSPPRPGRC